MREDHLYSQRTLDTHDGELSQILKRRSDVAEERCDPWGIRVGRAVNLDLRYGS